MVKIYQKMKETMQKYLYYQQTYEGRQKHSAWEKQDFK